MNSRNSNFKAKNLKTHQWLIAIPLILVQCWTIMQKMKSTDPASLHKFYVKKSNDRFDTENSRTSMDP